MNSEFLDLIRSGQRFLLTGHEYPDGDCLGSQVGLYHLLRELDADVQIFNPDPVATSLSFLAEQTPIANYRESPTVPECDVVMLLDCATLSRLGDLGAILRRREQTVAVLDHHVGSEAGDGDVHYVDVSAAATGVLVYNLYGAFSVTISPVAAEAIFVSIVADTGWFKYSNTDAATMRIAGEMIAAGARPDHLFDRMYRDQDPRSLGILADALRAHESRLDGRFGFTLLGADLMGRVSRCGFDTDNILEPIRSVAGIEVAGLFKAVGERRTKMSLRAMGDVDVQEIAAALGGGGHKKAAGATMSLTPREAIDAVEKLVATALGGA